MKSIKRAVAYSLLAAVAFTSVTPTSVGAYGETADKSTLVKDTSALADYVSWKANTWTGKESADSSKIALTPGATEKDLNFAWYSEEKGTPVVKVGTKEDLSDAVEYPGTATAIERSNWKNTYKASNKVSIEGKFEENTTYYYSYTDDKTTGTWSAAQKYTTNDADSYKFVVVGDPQVGASGGTGEGTEDDINIAVDTYNWNQTLNTVAKNDGDANFILSVGDQINYSNEDKDDTKNVRESEYAGFLYPSLLRNMSLATAIGNHESKGTDYQYHYNNPNSSDNLGATNSGSDYYFSYGDVLYIMLNSNNRNTAEHATLMDKAVKSNPNAKWKIVAFHHDIYGSGQPHSDTDGANLRTLFAPLMDQFDIDVCLTGHDHSYARTYQVLDGTAINYETADASTTSAGAIATNPEGTLYVAAGSASGSKFYNLATTKQYYVAERSNTQVPTYSTIDVSSGKLVIKTFDYTGAKYANDFTIVKEDVDRKAVQEVLDEAATKKEADYTAESWNRLQDAIAAVNAKLQFTAEDTGATKLAADYDKSLSVNNAKDMLDYYGYAQKDYATDFANGNTKLKEGISTLLDKTMVSTKITSLTGADYEKVYQELVTSLAGLKVPEKEDDPSTSTSPSPSATASVEPSASASTSPLPSATASVEPSASASVSPSPSATASAKPNTSTRDDSVITISADPTTAPKASLTVKKGSKTLKSSTTIKLKKGKSFTVKAVKKNTSSKVKFKSSNKKSVTVSSKGKVTAKKYTGKKVKITVTCGKLKKTFKVIVTKK